MLGFISKYGSSRGMATVPDISGLGASAAAQAIKDKFLQPGTVTTTTTPNSALNGTVAAQGLSAGSVVELDTIINYVTYVYVSPAPYVTGYGSCNSSSGSYVDCPACGGTQGRTVSYTSYRQTRYWSDGTTDSVSCGSTVYGYGTCGNKTDCGWVAPTCANADTYGAFGDWGTCKVGVLEVKRCRSYTDSNCVTTPKADCEYKGCKCPVSTVYNPENYGKCLSTGYKWRDVTWVKADCSTGTYSQKKAC